MHRLLKPADYVRMPWKDGGGHTTEIAAHPADATLASFDWRVSIADVAADGPFSCYPGVDRVIVLVSGAGMRLTGDAHTAELRAPFEPYAFSGDDVLSCSLIEGPVRDFNLMLRRGRTQGRVGGEMHARLDHGLAAALRREAGFDRANDLVVG